MQAEMNKLFAEGGVMQEGGTVDPVSGNDVPPGAMQEEVRDDIPAQLSEGEFVFPADVVRFYGLEKLMMMRDKAKKGLQRMNEIGQMGNAEEVEDAESLFGGEGMDDDAFSSEIDSIMAEDSGGETRGYAKGGDVRKYAPGGYVGGEENAQLYRDAPIKGFEMVPMTNDAGQTIYIPFINGVAQLSIPSGYKVKKANDVTKVDDKTTTDATTTAADTSGAGGDSGGGGGNTDGTTPGVQGSFSPVTGQQVGIVTSVLGMMGLPGMTIANLGKNSIADAINTMGYNSAVSNNMSVVGEMMGLDPNDPANTAAISAAIDSTPNMGEQTSAPTATVGSTGTGGAAAAAAAAAASAAAANGLSDAAQGAASQAAASATVAGATPSEAAAAGQAAAADAAMSEAVESAVAAEAEAGFTAPGMDAGQPDGGGSEGSVGDTSGGYGEDAGFGLAKGGFVSKPKKNKVKPKGLAGRR